ncbi:unnamed protein product [Euphydryas editha]|uniref:CCHC-type domain-containing protein n=1 Tax=Euphydryas editha TaxID=104508 RepID=A0AAU9VA10_EUPED|nr:unnamed protein product [Euphydryas editha]
MLKEAETEHQLPTLLAPKVVSTLPTPRTRTITESTVTVDSGADADSESGITGDKREFRKAKRKQRTSPEAGNKDAKKIKGAESVPPVENTRQTPEKKETDWQEVKSKKKKKKQRAEQPLKQSEQKKPRKSVPRPNALIVRPKEKDKYADILGRVKKDVADDQVRSTVDKIRRTATGDLLIILTKENTDRGQDLRKTISKLLGNDAEVISKGPQEEIEILDLDDTTTKQDILEALQKAVGAEAEVTLDAIRSLRKAYGGTQIASITLAASVVKQVLRDNSKIRIGWVNCRIRLVERPTKCFKCWHYGHLATKCKSVVDRSNLCTKCGECGHKAATCKKDARCALCVEKGNANSCAHIAGSSRCPVFKEALLKVKKKRI